MDTQRVGHTSLLLGAGRSKKEDIIQPGAGILLAAKRGDRVLQGDLLATLYSDDKDAFASAEEELLSAFVFTDAPVVDVPLIYETIH